MTNSAPVARYRIGDLARLAGPAISTLRTWQDRYPGLLRPGRTVGGHRLYDDDDLAAVQAMQRLVAAGHTVSAAAGRVIEQRDGGATPVEGGADDPPAPPGTGGARTWWASTVTDEVAGLRAAHQATRALLRATTPRDAAAALQRFVTQLGGTVSPADEGGEAALPLDISLGVGDPVLPHAAVGSPARRRLEALLPGLVEDARLAAGRLRAQRGRHTS